MQINSNIEKVIARLKQAAEKAKTLDFSEALAVGVNAALGQMKFRVFNTGKDVKGIAFGKYIGKKTRVTNRKFRVKKYGIAELNKERKTNRKGIKSSVASGDQFTEYEKIRLAKGRQIRYKDLEFTGALRRGIVVVTESHTKVIVAIPNEQLLKIAKGQTQQISKILGTEVNIFGLSDEERDLMNKNTNEALKQLYARLFNS